MEAVMSTTPTDHSFIGELTNFVKFLQSLWGTLAAITILFPLSNQLFGVVLLPESSILIPIDVYTPLATISCLILVLVIFGRRNYIYSSSVFNTPRDDTGIRGEDDGMISEWHRRHQEEWDRHRREEQREWDRRSITRRSVVYFVIGFLSIVLYFIARGYVSFASDALLNAFVAESLSLVFYSAGFAFITASFTLLGLMEFVADRD
jgi:hypothetical protein